MQHAVDVAQQALRGRLDAALVFMRVEVQMRRSRRAWFALSRSRDGMVNSLTPTGMNSPSRTFRLVHLCASAGSRTRPSHRRRAQRRMRIGAERELPVARRVEPLGDEGLPRIRRMDTEMIGRKRFGGTRKARVLDAAVLVVEHRKALREDAARTADLADPRRRNR
jgi:hypothetical protein